MGKHKTAEQTRILVEFMEKNPEARFCTKGNRDRERDLWKELTKLLNSHGPPISSTEKWKKTWSDWRFKIRKKLAHLRGETQATDVDVSNSFSISSLEDRVANLTGLHSDIDGVQCYAVFDYDEEDEDEEEEMEQEQDREQEQVVSLHELEEHAKTSSQDNSIVDDLQDASRFSPKEEEISLNESSPRKRSRSLVSKKNSIKPLQVNSVANIIQGAFAFGLDEEELAVNEFKETVKNSFQNNAKINAIRAASGIALCEEEVSINDSVSIKRSNSPELEENESWSYQNNSTVNNIQGAVGFGLDEEEISLNDSVSIKRSNSPELDESKECSFEENSVVNSFQSAAVFGLDKVEVTTQQIMSIKRSHNNLDLEKNTKRLCKDKSFVKTPVISPSTSCGDCSNSTTKVLTALTEAINKQTLESKRHNEKMEEIAKEQNIILENLLGLYSLKEKN